MTAHESTPEHPGVELFRTLIKPKKIQQKELRERMGLSVMGLYKILRGTTRINPEIAWKFEVVLGVSAAELIEKQAAYDLWKARQILEECKDWQAQPMLASPQMNLTMR